MLAGINKIGFAAFTFALLCLCTGLAQAEVVVRQEMEKGVYGAIKGGRVLYLECHLPEGDGCKALLEKYLAQPETWKNYQGIAAVAIPYFKLNASSQRKLVESMFPDDYADEKGWWHTVVLDDGSGVETWDSIALWLSGEEGAHKAIMNAPENKGIGGSLKQGQTVLVPRTLLRKELSAPSPVRPKKTVMASLPVAPPVLSAKGLTQNEPQTFPASMSDGRPGNRRLPASMTETNPAPKPFPASMTEVKAEITAKAVVPVAPEVKELPLAEPKITEKKEVAVAVAATQPELKQEAEKVAREKVKNEEEAEEPGNALVALNPDMEMEGESGVEGGVVNDISTPLLDGDLSYGEDKSGRFATYKMKRGDALYSSVVARFTDYSENAEIQTALATIQQRSGISDPRKMTAGQAVKIPLEMLADRYHPQGSEQREQFNEIQTAVERVGTKRSVARDLEGVVLILDPGHGGRDQGAAPWAKMGIFEDEVVYDISCRIKEIIERDTRAKMYLTTMDPNQLYKPTNATKFTHDTDEIVLTSPAYPNEDARISANLRWYLANDIYKKELESGTPSDKVVFVSLHCDALYTPQLRGAMVYVPGAQYRRDSEQPSGAVYANYNEVKRQPVVKTTYSQRVNDEALSRNFAQTMLNALQTNDPPIKVHDAGDPIRNVIRQSGGRAYVPAVLRNAIIPTKILLEAANLTNVIDRQRVADPEWRQHFANAFVAALRQHFAAQSPSVQVAAKR